MKKIAISIIFVLLMTSCAKTSHFVLEGEVYNANDGEMISISYPVYRDGIWYEQCDTTYIDNGKFIFEGEADGVIPANLTFQNMDQTLLFLEPSNMVFSAERSTLYDYSISGLSIGNHLSEYRKAFAEYDKIIYEILYEAMRKNEEWSKANNEGSADADRLWTEFYAIVMQHHAISNTWPDLAIGFVKSHSTNILVPYVIDSLIRCDYDKQIIESLISALSPEQQRSTLGQLMTIRHDISMLDGGQVGSRVIDFPISALDGSSVALSEYYAKGYVLLDFWASWCRPCINEIPKVRNLHEEYGDKLQILSVSVDKDETEWRDAVERLNLMQWPQLIVDYPNNAENYYFAEQADMSLAYGIEQIPCFILIDTDGIIVGRWSHLTPTTISEINRCVLR